MSDFFVKVDNQGKEIEEAITAPDIEGAVGQLIGELQPSAYHLSAVLLASGWTLNNNLYEYTYLNSMIKNTTFAIVSFDSASIEIVRMADFMPINESVNGGLKVFAKNQPLADISINITVTGIVQADPGIAELLNGKADKTKIYNQTNFAIDGNNGNYFIIDAGADGNITASNLEIGVSYGIFIRNTYTNTITAMLPNETIDKTPEVSVQIPVGKTQELGVIWTGVERVWQNGASER